jgi:hypothetical protein
MYEKSSLSPLSQTPYYSIYLKGENGYVKVIFEPSLKFQDFETVAKDMSKQNSDVVLKNIYNQL